MWENMHKPASSNIQNSSNEAGKVKGISSDSGYGSMKGLRLAYPMLLFRLCRIVKANVSVMKHIQYATVMMICIATYVPDKLTAQSCRAGFSALAKSTARKP